MKMVPIFGWSLNDLTPITDTYVKQVFRILHFCRVLFAIKKFLLLSYYLYIPVLNFSSS